MCTLMHKASLHPPHSSRCRSGGTFTKGEARRVNGGMRTRISRVNTSQCAQRASSSAGCDDRKQDRKQEITAGTPSQCDGRAGGGDNTHAASANCCSTKGDKHSKMTSSCAQLLITPVACH
jgi:hypothetical protein